MSSFVEFGTHVPGSPACPEIQGIIKACDKNRDFSIVEIHDVDRPGDTVILDCVCQEIGNRNPTGIRSRERLAVVFAAPVDSENPYSVRALRVGFPLTIHQNSVLEGEPPSLCLYLEPWETLERTWTPEAFLKRIQWWLINAAQGTLHGPDQSLEQLYFRSPITVVLPRRLNGEDSLAFGLSGLYGNSQEGRHLFVRCLEAASTDAVKSCHVLRLPSVVHGPILGTPRTLGDLERQLNGRKSGFITKLRAAIRLMIPQNGVPKSAGNDFWATHSLLILQIPILREENGTAELIEQRGFLINAGILDVGIAAGVVNSLNPNTYFNLQLVGAASTAVSDAWLQISILQVEVLEPLDGANARKMSDIDASQGEFQGMVAGVGALGSSLAQIWAREAWGQWTLVDHDLIRPHNLARHLSFDNDIGLPKADAVAHYINHIYPSRVSRHMADVTKANFYLEPKEMSQLATFDLVVDVSTTLGLPRDLSRNDVAKRCVSTFLTPLGTSSVLMLEDSGRNVRLDTLEAQYYRGIINEPWGASHLLGNRSQFSVGAGCRDISVAISNELIQLHAALLARQIRKRTQISDASLLIFVGDDESGAISVHSISITSPVSHRCGDWEIMLDDHLVTKLHELRNQALPLETGGIIVGYKDFKLKRISIVEVLPQPIDSSSSREFFIRGKEGTLAAIQEIRQRTGEIVDYLGEWHSHPEGVDCTPSRADHKLLQTMGTFSALEGDPFLMMIVCKDRLKSFVASEVA